MLEWEFFHQIVDIFTFLGWVGHLTGQILFALFSPIFFIFSYFKSLLAGLTAPAITPIFDIPGSEFFDAIPYFSEITGVLTACLLLWLYLSTIKHLTHL